MKVNIRSFGTPDIPTHKFVFTLLLLLLPSMSWAWMGSLIQTGHSASCNVNLGKSLIERKEKISALLSADLSHIKAHHQKLNQMSDEEFKQYIVGEVGAVAFCHPVASELIGGIPGKDYLDPVNSVTSLPSSIDRKVTYSIWAYSAMYRSLYRFIDDLESRLPSMAAWDRRRYVDDFASAKRTLEELRGRSLDQLVDTGGMSENHRRQLEAALNEIKLSIDTSQSNAYYGKDLASEKHSSERLPKVTSLEEVSSPAINEAATLWPDVEQPSENVTENLVDRDDSSERSLSGPLRPTISTYTMVGQTLYIHELQTIHLFFPSSLGPKESCFKRLLPEYPHFARLLTSGPATLAAKIDLSESEYSKIMRFFQSAAGIEAVSDFMMSDTTAVVKTDVSPPASLSQCLSLVEGTSSHKAHQTLLSVRETREIHSASWLSGKTVRFSEHDAIWQSLMAMLAAKRIENAQSSR